MRVPPLLVPGRFQCIAIGPPDGLLLWLLEGRHFPSYRPSTPLRRGVPEVVTVLAQRLDVLGLVVRDVLIDVMRLKFPTVPARTARRREMFPRPP